MDGLTSWFMLAIPFVGALCALWLVRYIIEALRKDDD